MSETTISGILMVIQKHIQYITHTDLVYATTFAGVPHIMTIFNYIRLDYITLCDTIFPLPGV